MRKIKYELIKSQSPINSGEIQSAIGVFDAHPHLALGLNPLLIAGKFRGQKSNPQTIKRTTIVSIPY